jgi:hypothetical protein
VALGWHFGLGCRLKLQGLSAVLSVQEPRLDVLVNQVFAFRLLKFYFSNFVLHFQLLLFYLHQHLLFKQVRL